MLSALCPQNSPMFLLCSALAENENPMKSNHLAPARSSPKAEVTDSTPAGAPISFITSKTRSRRENFAARQAGIWEQTNSFDDSTRQKIVQKSLLSGVEEGIKGIHVRKAQRRFDALF